MLQIYLNSYTQSANKTIYLYNTRGGCNIVSSQRFRQIHCAICTVHYEELIKYVIRLKDAVRQLSAGVVGRQPVHCRELDYKEKHIFIVEKTTPNQQKLYQQTVLIQLRKQLLTSKKLNKQTVLIQLRRQLLISKSKNQQTVVLVDLPVFSLIVFERVELLTDSLMMSILIVVSTTLSGYDESQACTLS